MVPNADKIRQIHYKCNYFFPIYARTMLSLDSSSKKIVNYMFNLMIIYHYFIDYSPLFHWLFTIILMTIYHYSNDYLPSFFPNFNTINSFFVRAVDLSKQYMVGSYNSFISCGLRVSKFIRNGRVCEHFILTLMFFVYIRTRIPRKETCK